MMPSPFICLENVRHSNQEKMEVKQQLSDFEVSAQTDAIWVSGIPRLRVFFTNIKPSPKSTEEKKSPWSIQSRRRSCQIRMGKFIRFR